MSDEGRGNKSHPASRIPNPSNKKFALNLALLALGMLALAYASVPLYRLFCQATGYNGTTQEGAYTPGHVIDHEINVTFNADTDPHLPWEFAPAQRSIKVKVGAQNFIHYTARNNSTKAITGRAVYNVTPFQAGQYFIKIACFCFKEQTLAAGQKVDMPVVFTIDPAIMDDPEMKNATTITLSYTFFPVKN